jgi:hypothetical protein
MSCFGQLCFGEAKERLQLSVHRSIASANIVRRSAGVTANAVHTVIANIADEFRGHYSFVQVIQSVMGE